MNPPGENAFRRSMAFGIVFTAGLLALLGSQEVNGAVITRTASSQDYLIIPQFDHSLGVMIGATMEVSWSGKTSTTNGPPSTRAIA